MATGYDRYDQTYSLGYESGHGDWSPFPRVNKLRRTFLDREYYIDVERFRNVTSAYQENERVPTIIRCARAFEKILMNASLFIYDDDLILGEIAAPAKASPQYPEFSVNWMLYEVMNEPHFSSGNLKSDIAKWGKIQGNVLKAIREIDKNHAVIVGGGDWNSLDSMLVLPDYADENLIYNFHDYTPFLFTHQGAAWTHTKRLTHIPFPYVKEKMPPLPKNASQDEKREWSNYEKNSSEEVLLAPLDKAVEFANKRKAGLMCNEFGVYMNYAEPEERVNWYRIKCGWMDERKIIRVSWDYTQEFGVFNSTNESRFPEDLNKALVEAMGYKVPGGKSASWFSRAKESCDWTIYKNGSVGLLSAYAHGAEGSLTQKTGSEEAISLESINPYGQICFAFGEACDFSDLVDSGARLEFFIKSSDKALNLSLYFRDMEAKIFPWRASYSLSTKVFKADGQWQKVSLPLKDFSDIGGWTNADGWKNGEKKFSWKLVDALIFENGTSASKSGLMLRDIKILQ